MLLDITARMFCWVLSCKDLINNAGTWNHDITCYLPPLEPLFTIICWVPEWNRLRPRKLLAGIWCPISYLPFIWWLGCGAVIGLSIHIQGKPNAALARNCTVHSNVFRPLYCSTIWFVINRSGSRLWADSRRAAGAPYKHWVSNTIPSWSKYVMRTKNQVSLAKTQELEHTYSHCKQTCNLQAFES